MLSTVLYLMEKYAWTYVFVYRLQSTDDIPSAFHVWNSDCKHFNNHIFPKQFLTVFFQFRRKIKFCTDFFYAQILLKNIKLSALVLFLIKSVLSQNVLNTVGDQQKYSPVHQKKWDLGNWSYVQNTQKRKQCRLWIILQKTTLVCREGFIFLPCNN